MEKDKNKKSFWEEFFGISDEEVSKVEKNSTEESTDASEKTEESKILETKNVSEKKEKGRFLENVDVSEKKEERSVSETESVSEEEKTRFLDVLEEDDKNSIEEKERKVIPVQNGLRELPEAPAGSYFFVHNGSTLKNLHDLEYYLGTMTGAQFNHHVADGRNDFASWVKDVLGEKTLALQLEKAKDRESMQEILVHFLNLK